MKTQVIRSAHPYEPYIPKGATKLIIGTIPPHRFCDRSEELCPGDVDFYYGSYLNRFWHLVSEVTGIRLAFENTKAAVKQRKDLLKDLNMGIMDVVKICSRKEGKSKIAKADDASLEVIETQPLEGLLSKYPDIDTLLYTSGSSNGVKGQVYRMLKAEHKLIDKENREYQISVNGKEYKVIILYSPSPRAKAYASKRQAQYERVFGLND